MSRKKPYRILFVHTTQGYRLTGAPRMVHSLVTELDPERFEPAFVTQKRSELSESLGEYGVPVRILPLPGSIDVYGNALTQPTTRQALAALQGVVSYNLTMLRAIRELKPDVIWVNNLRSFFTVFLAAMLRRTPVVWNIWLGQKSNGLLRFMNTVALKLSRRIVTEYHAQADEIFTREQIERSAGKIRTVYTGHPVPEPVTRAARGASSLVVGSIGAFSPRKGQHVFLEMARILRSRSGAFRFTIAGEPASEEFDDYARGLRDFVREHGLEMEVTWAGWVHEPHDFLSRVDVFVQSSSDEGLPGAVREAMMAALPVVATRVGGTAEIVVDGETGFLVDPGDAEALAERLVWIAENPDEARRMGEAGRERAESLFSREAFLGAYQDVLEEALRAE